MKKNKPICEIDKSGTRWWRLNGLFHRLDGPAIEYKNGTNHWYINGYNVTDIITDWANENDIDLDNLSEVDKALIKIIWADYGKT